MTESASRQALATLLVKLDQILDEVARKADHVVLREAYVGLTARQARVSLMAVLALSSPSVVPRWIPAREAASRLACSVKTLARRRNLEGYREFIVPGDARGFKVDLQKFEEFLRRR